MRGFARSEKLACLALVTLTLFYCIAILINTQTILLFWRVDRRCPGSHILFTLWWLQIVQDPTRRQPTMTADVPTADGITPRKQIRAANLNHE
jgi:hypothetical protein